MKDMYGGQFGLTAFEEIVLIERGYMTPRPFTLQEIAEAYGVPKQTIHAILKRAMGKVAQVDALKECV